MNGKILRLKRFTHSASGRIVIFPLDHGVSCGPIPGLENMDRVIRLGVRGGADALVLHKGMLRFLEPIRERLPGIFMHLSASTQLGPAFHRKVLIGTVEEAIRRGADGVSMHVNLGDAHEPEMLEDLGEVGAACALWQIPLLVMIYVRGVGIPAPVPDSAIAHCTRVAAELGADLIKIPTPREEATLKAIAESTPVPVVMAGGSKQDDALPFLEGIEGALRAGIRGVAVGRNVFQNPEPERLLRAVTRMVHEGMGAREAFGQAAG
jgi:predicted phospho-2-dehydro-3-deoxyheptonate aldolase